MKTIAFDLVWEVRGKQTMEVPDDLNSKEAIRSYIMESWETDGIALPGNVEYVPDSAYIISINN